MEREIVFSLSSLLVALQSGAALGDDGVFCVGQAGPVDCGKGARHMNVSVALALPDLKLLEGVPAARVYSVRYAV
jgi:hypothetical protein